MKLYDCPHCGKPGISRLRRSCLGPALPATCRSCGRKIGVPWSSVLLVIPSSIVLGLLGFVAFYYSGLPLVIVVFVAYLVAAYYLCDRIPLVRR